MELNANNQKFVNESLKKGFRVDGRGIYDLRNLKIDLGNQYGSVEVQLGETRVHAKTSIELARPLPDRPSEGIFIISVDFSGPGSLQQGEKVSGPASGVAAGSDAEGRAAAQEVAISRLLEKILKSTRVVDVESLCISVGEQVWRLRVDVHFLDYGGNYLDAGIIAAVSSLSHFRRPEVLKVGETTTIYSVEERAPVPLSINNIPACLTFAYFENELLVLDPSYLEEKFMSGSISIAINSNSELCCISKAGGIAIEPDTVNLCIVVAIEKAKFLIDAIRSALK
ncbi:hypothetical protein BB560_001500 [Smittium megazygosporum]|uniref:Uncharacterized protein n=1 Tax=Smittium megazygosporum TaxID=133381 RepID=A0A2T9ZHE8_9FUNG|nr:hypothetical protein BB560_001500 [Smittium megazygosporum]